uniref:STARD3 N-terminal like n=1 Tax=Corvus moneduloides TaxID=1196302 RepID=A0A8C3EUE3_CORMO
EPYLRAARAASARALPPAPRVPRARGGRGGGAGRSHRIPRPVRGEGGRAGPAPCRRPRPARPRGLRRCPVRRGRLCGGERRAGVKGGIETTLEKEVLHYDYSSSYFDIFLLAVFRFKVLILAYAMCRLRHWWAIAFTTAVTSAFLLAKVIISQLFSQGAFGYVLPIISFILAWIETWFLDFKVLPQEAEEENRFLIAQDASERAALLHPGVLSDGQFYSPPESVAGSDEDSEEKQDSEKPIV